MKIAILDDYQNVALKMADWSAVSDRAGITVFKDHVDDPAAVVARLRPFDVICAMRERTRFSREVIQQLPNLKLIVSTGPRNAATTRPPQKSAGSLLQPPDTRRCLPWN